MFGIGMQEVVLICAIALVVVGPKRLPEIARALGKGYAEFRRAFDDMKRNVEADIDAAELRRSFLDLPPPPPAAAPPPTESLLPVPPAAPAAPSPAPSPYPEIIDGGPPTPEGPGPAAGGGASEADRGRA